MKLDLQIVDSAVYLAQNLEKVPVHIIAAIEGRVENAGAAFQASAYGSILPAVWSLMLALRARGVRELLHLPRADAYQRQEELASKKEKLSPQRHGDTERPVTFDDRPRSRQVHSRWPLDSPARSHRFAIDLNVSVPLW